MMRAVLAAVASVVVLGACTHGSSRASSSTVGSTTAPSTTSAAGTTSTTLPATTTSTEPVPTTVPRPPPPATVPTAVIGCRSANLTLSVGSLEGAAGTQYFQLGFRNHASIACTLVGFPGVSFLDASGRQIGVPARRNATQYSRVTIAPAASAYALVGVGNPGVFDCAGATAQSVRVFPPNETAAILVAAPTGLLVCPNQGAPSVDPVVAHSNG